MSDSAVAHRILPVLAMLLLGCSRGDSDDRVPLGQSAGNAGQTAGAPRITGEAKIALDSGNVLFRAKAYDLALAQYRRSAQLAPADVTPLFGVLMVAEATNNAKLADSVRTVMRSLNPAAADSSTAAGHADIVDRHSRVPPPDVVSPHPPPPRRQ